MKKLKNMLKIQDHEKKKIFNDSEAVRVDKSNFGYKHYDCVKKYQSLVTWTQ